MTFAFDSKKESEYLAWDPAATGTIGVRGQPHAGTIMQRHSRSRVDREEPAYTV